MLRHCLALGLVVAAAQPALAEADKSAKITVGWAGPFDTLNPATTGNRNVGPVNINMFDTLVWLTPDFQVTPGLATKWEMEPAIIEAIKNQYQVSESHTGPVAICLFAEYLCGLKKLRVSGECDDPHLDPSVWQHLGLDKTALVELLTRVNDEVDNARQLMALAS